MKKPKVLYVDDEPNNLTSFHAVFREEFDIITSHSPKQALQLLAQHPVEVLITDQRMPEQSGVSFLEEVFEKYPDVVRILMTGYDDMEPVVNAINRAKIYQYISKPWREHDIRIVVNNAAELHRNTVTIRTTNNELRKALDDLQKFIYSASHDLRAPLLSILGLAKVASIDPENQAEYWPLVQESAQRLDFYVSNIISHYRNNRFATQADEVWVEKLTHEVLAELQHYQSLAALQLRVEVEQSSPFRTDMLRLKSILSNLLSNAAKYQRPQGADRYIAVAAQVRDEELRLQISDNGTGIAPEHMPRLFEMFYRGDAEKTGSGLGLYIVQEAVSKLNGTIRVNSTPGQGTTFYINLPAVS